MLTVKCVVKLDTSSEILEQLQVEFVKCGLSVAQALIDFEMRTVFSRNAWRNIN